MADSSDGNDHHMGGANDGPSGSNPNHTRGNNPNHHRGPRVCHRCRHLRIRCDVAHRGSNQLCSPCLGALRATGIMPSCEAGRAPPIGQDIRQQQGRNASQRGSFFGEDRRSVGPHRPEFRGRSPPPPYQRTRPPLHEVYRGPPPARDYGSHNYAPDDHGAYYTPPPREQGFPQYGHGHYGPAQYGQQGFADHERAQYGGPRHFDPPPYGHSQPSGPPPYGAPQHGPPEYTSRHHDARFSPDRSHGRFSPVSGFRDGPSSFPPGSIDPSVVESLQRRLQNLEEESDNRLTMEAERAIRDRHARNQGGGTGPGRTPFGASKTAPPFGNAGHGTRVDPAGRVQKHRKRGGKQVRERKELLALFRERKAKGKPPPDEKKVGAMEGVEETLTKAVQTNEQNEPGFVFDPNNRFGNASGANNGGANNSGASGRPQTADPAPTLEMSVDMAKAHIEKILSAIANGQITDGDWTLAQEFWESGLRATDGRFGLTGHWDAERARLVAQWAGVVLRVEQAQRERQQQHQQQGPPVQPPPVQPQQQRAQPVQQSQMQQRATSPSRSQPLPMESPVPLPPFRMNSAGGNSRQDESAKVAAKYALPDDDKLFDDDDEVK